MTESEARDFFLEKIRNRLAQEGRPLAGLELEYWEALRPPDEESLDKILFDNKGKKKEFAAIEDKFESTLHDVISSDLASDLSSRERYLAALNAINGVDGIQLQALVSSVALKFKELDESKPWKNVLMVVVTLALIALGGWIGIHLRK